LEERFIYEVLDCFLGVRDRNDFEKVLVDETAGKDLPCSEKPWQGQR